MKAVAVICEYNPFHLGHLYQLKEIRRRGADCIIGIMSGNFTQRGEPAIIPKHERAEMAVSAGMDLVVELPFPYCAGYAEAFAAAGVAIAEGLCANEICFGSETGEISILERLAELSLSAEFESAYAARRADGAAAFYRLLEELGGVDGLRSNDILGLQYIRAAKKAGYDIGFSTIRRCGSAYRELGTDSAIPSAGALRSLWSETQSEESLSPFIPDSCMRVLRNAVRRGIAPIKSGALDSLVIGTFRLADPCTLSDVADVPVGFANRLCSMANRVTTIDELVKGLTNRDFTPARIMRIILYALTGAHRSDLDIQSSPIGYVNLLAANQVGCKYLSSIRKSDFVLTKAANAPIHDSVQYRRLKLSEKADAIYTLAMPKPVESGYFVKHPPYIGIHNGDKEQ